MWSYRWEAANAMWKSAFSCSRRPPASGRTSRGFASCCARETRTTRCCSSSTSTTAVTDGGNENPTISGYSTKTAGDVIIYGNNEYVYTANNKWELLGQDGSYKITQTAVSKPAAVTNKWISVIGQNANGEIDVSYADLDIATLASDSGFITGMFIASYGSSTYADVLAAYQAKKIVYCRASSNSDPSSGEQKRLAFLAYVNYDTTPTEFEF